MKLKKISLPPIMTKIEDKAFYKCEELEEISIPSTIKEIGDESFSRCIKLKNIDIPSSVLEIGSSAFNQCDSLISVNIQSQITKIKKSTFAYCVSLTDIIIPDSVTYIGKKAFVSCRSLKQIKLPPSIKSIESGTFFSCESLIEINIPDSVTIIKDNAFNSCHSLVKVSFPPSVTKIGENAFQKCSSLEEVSMPKVASIGLEAFDECFSLKKVYAGQSSYSYNFPSRVKIIRFREKEKKNNKSNYFDRELFPTKSKKSSITSDKDKKSANSSRKNDYVNNRDFHLSKPSSNSKYDNIFIPVSQSLKNSLEEYVTLMSHLNKSRNLKPSENISDIDDQDKSSSCATKKSTYVYDRNFFIDKSSKNTSDSGDQNISPLKQPNNLSGSCHLGFSFVKLSNDSPNSCNKEISVSKSSENIIILDTSNQEQTPSDSLEKNSYNSSILHDENNNLDISHLNQINETSKSSDLNISVAKPSQNISDEVCEDQLPSNPPEKSTFVYDRNFFISKPSNSFSNTNDKNSNLDISPLNQINDSIDECTPNISVSEISGNNSSTDDQDSSSDNSSKNNLYDNHHDFFDVKSSLNIYDAEDQYITSPNNLSDSYGLGFSFSKLSNDCLNECNHEISVSKPSENISDTDDQDQLLNNTVKKSTYVYDRNFFLARSSENDDNKKDISSPNQSNNLSNSCNLGFSFAKLSNEITEDSPDSSNQEISVLKPSENIPDTNNQEQAPTNSIKKSTYVYDRNFFISKPSNNSLNLHDKESNQVISPSNLLNSSFNAYDQDHSYNYDRNLIIAKSSKNDDDQEISPPNQPNNISSSCGLGFSFAKLSNDSPDSSNQEISVLKPSENIPDTNNQEQAPTNSIKKSTYVYDRNFFISKPSNNSLDLHDKESNQVISPSNLPNNSFNACYQDHSYNYDRNLIIAKSSKNDQKISPPNQSKSLSSSCNLGFSFVKLSNEITEDSPDSSNQEISVLKPSENIPDTNNQEQASTNSIKKSTYVYDRNFFLAKSSNT